MNSKELVLNDKNTTDPRGTTSPPQKKEYQNQNSLLTTPIYKMDKRFFTFSEEKKRILSLL